VIAGLNGICGGASLESDRQGHFILRERGATGAHRFGCPLRDGAGDEERCHSCKHRGHDASMPTDYTGEITTGKGCEHSRRLKAHRGSRKWLSTGQLVELDGVEVLGAGVLGAGALLDVDVDVLLDVDDELEPPVFDFLSRESLR
jgi:hypothetical protein